MSEYYNQKQCHAEEYSNEYPQLSGIFKYESGGQVNRCVTA